jgi:ATP-binding cassette, subfamily B, bacterial
VLAVVYAVVLLVFSPTFALVVGGFGLVQVLLVVIPARRVARLTVATLSEAGKTSGIAAEALRGISSVKLAAGEAWALSRWRAQYERQLAASSRQGRLTAVTSAALSAVSGTSVLALPFVAAWQVLSGRLSIGAMFGLVALAANFSQPLSRLTASFQQLQSVQSILHRLGAVLAVAPEQADGPRRAAPPLTGHIALINVGLRHAGGTGWAVRHIHLTIHAGTRAALVGPSGSGKSTLVNLILGLYPATEGKILLDGCDLAELDHQTVRRQCGVVTQEAAVFNGTIRQNIAFGTPGLTLADVRRAARLADLERDIADMPMGYETIIAEHGSALSGGQRQRLALARALARDPAILILDEATSALDTPTEATISQNLANAAITTITVAHRLSTIRHADIIIVMNNGAIAEIGNHSLLTATGGLYATMVDATGPPGYQAQPSLPTSHRQDVRKPANQSSRDSMRIVGGVARNG